MLELEVRQLSPVEGNLNYTDTERCQCSTCHFCRRWHQTCVRMLFSGLLFPPLWLCSSVFIIGGLIYYCDERPLRFDSFIQVFSAIIVSNNEHESEDLRFVSHHNKTRANLVSLVWYNFVATTMYGFLIWMLIYPLLYGIHRVH